MIKKPTQKVVGQLIKHFNQGYKAGLVDGAIDELERIADAHEYIKRWGARDYAKKRMSIKSDNTCPVCGASPMTAKCNNAGCEDK